MGYHSSGLVEFRATLARHIRALERGYPERLTTEWFFLRYLQRLVRRAELAEAARDLSGVMRGLTRYYVDRVDPGSPLAEIYEDVLAAHGEALRDDHKVWE
jgi:hypothetical protein